MKSWLPVLLGCIRSAESLLPARATLEWPR